MSQIKNLEEVMLEAIDQARLLVRDDKQEEAEMVLETVPTNMTVYELTKETEIVYE
tara:strand:+ start:1101 stop:1268 length:168 start_codon:yes stop_codon:yes gene_type:complete